MQRAKRVTSLLIILIITILPVSLFSAGQWEYVSDSGAVIASPGVENTNWWFFTPMITTVIP